MEVYVDEFGNEVTIQALKEMFGDQWETEAANLGYSKKAEGVVAEDATVTPIETGASENMELSSADPLLELEDEWEVVVPNQTKVVVPENRKFGDIIEIPDFENQNTKDLANAYNTLYGGENGGFHFEADGKYGLNITALNGNEIGIKTGLTNMEILGSGLYTPETVDMKDAESMINEFLKLNFDSEAQDQYNKNIDVFEEEVMLNVNDLTRKFLEEEDYETDNFMPVNGLLTSPLSADYEKFIRQNVAETYKANGGFLPEYQITQNVKSILQDIQSNELQLNYLTRSKQYEELKNSDNGDLAIEDLKVGHIQEIVDPQERELASINMALINKDVLLNENFSNLGYNESINSLMNDRKKLEARRDLLQKEVFGKKTKFLFNLDTGAYRVTPESKGGIVVQNETDLTKQFSVAKINVREIMKSNPFATVQSKYNIFNVYFEDFKRQMQDEKYDITIDASFFQEGSPLAEKLNDMGYKIETREFGRDVVIEGGQGAPYVKDGVVKGVSLKDLMYLKRTNTIGKYQDFDKADKSQKPLGYTLDQYVENSNVTLNRLSVMREAWKQLYLLNVDPASIEASNVSPDGTGIEKLWKNNFVEGVVEALPFQDQSNYGYIASNKFNIDTDRDILDRFQMVIGDVNANLQEGETPFELTKEQEENFVQGFGEELVRGLGGFVPMIAELAAVTYLTGGAGNFLNTGRYLNKLRTVTYLAKSGRNSVTPISQTVVAARARRAGMTVDAYVKSKNLTKASGSALQKLQALGIMGLQEEAKMAALDPLFGVDMPVGAGFGFVVGGAGMRRLLPTSVFKGNYAPLNVFLEKGLYSGLGGAAGAQTAAPMEAMVQSFMNQTDMQTFAEEKYGDMEDWAKHALMETIQFSLIGLSHTNKADRTLSMRGKRALQEKLAVDIIKMQNQIGEGKLSKTDPKFINKSQLFEQVSQQIRISENRERYLDKNVLMADTKALFEKYNRQYKTETKSDQPAFDFKLQKSGKTEVVFRGSKPPLVRVNVNKMTPGTVPHEIFHTMMKQQFKNDVGLSGSLARNISSTLNKVDWTFGIKNVKGGLKGVVEQAYEKIQNKDSFSEEFNAAVIDLLRSPENYEKLITGNVFGQIVQDIYGAVEKTLGNTPMKGLLPDLNTPQKVINFLGRYGKSTAAGEYSPGMIERFKNIKIQKQKDGKVYDLVDTQTGKKLNLDKAGQELLKTQQQRNRELAENIKNKSGDYGKDIYDLIKDNQALINQALGFNAKIGDVQQSAITDALVYQMLGVAKGRKTGILDNYDGSTEVMTYLGNTLRSRRKEIYEEAGLDMTKRINEDISNIRGIEDAGGFKAESLDAAKPKAKTRKTDPRELDLTIDVKQELIPEMKKDISNRDMSKETYKSLRLSQAEAKLLAETYGIVDSKGNPLSEWFTNPKRNLPKAAIQGFRQLRSDLNKNAQAVLNIIPEGFTAGGKATGVPNNLKKLLYKKVNNRWELRKDLSIKDIQDILKEPAGALYRDAQVQTIKGLTELVFRGLKNKVAREAQGTGPESNAVIRDLADGKNPRMAQVILDAPNRPKTLSSIEKVFTAFSNYARDPEGFRKLYPDVAKFIEAESIKMSEAEAARGKAEAPTFKKAPKANMKIAEASGAPKGIKIENIIDGVTGKSFRSTQGDISLYDVARLEGFLGQAETLAKYLPKNLPEILRVKEILAQSFGITSRGTGNNVGVDNRKITTDGDLMANNPNSKNQIKRIIDNLGEKYAGEIFDNIKPGDFMTDAQQKKALERFQKTGDLKDLKKYINANDNAFKADAYYAFGVAKQKYLYDSKTPAEFETRARFIYDLAAANTSAIKGYGRQFVPIMAVKKTASPGVLKLEHLKSSLEQSMAEAKAIVEGKWAKDGRKIMNDYQGIISFKKYLDVIDKLGGTTNTAGLSRMVLDLKELKDYVTVESGFKQTLYDKLMQKNAQKLGQSIRKLEAPQLQDAMARMGLEPSRPNIEIAKYELANPKQTKQSYEANKALAKKSGTLSQVDLSKSELLNNMSNRDKALALARKLSKPSKGISVYDFDDTLARSKSNVLYELPNGTKGKLNATEFAKRSEALEAQGAKFDFSEFSRVIDGKPGPLIPRIKKAIGKFGNENMFVLTARPQNSAKAIHRFLKGIGVDIPLKNITGLADGSPTAKSNWILEKAAKGYNDFYFVDDAVKNVNAVKSVLDVIDVKSKVQLALQQVDLNKTFNEIIENKTGIGAKKVFGKAKAEVVGRGKGRFDVVVSPGAEDFMGLMYKTLGKGKVGEKQLAFYKKYLTDPFAKAEEMISKDQVTLAQDIKALKKSLGVVPKNLKKTNDTGFTNETAVRVRIWTKMGVEVPGLSKMDLKDLNKLVKDNPKLEAFADQLLLATKNSGWAPPKADWLSGNLTLDARNLLRDVKRSEYLEQYGWTENVNQIFSEANLNKLQAAFGKSYRDALEGTIARMKTGRNRKVRNNIENKVLDYINNSVGAIMFLNTRSAVLQTISSINFVNWTDNNPMAAGKALANMPQYSKDFLKLMNSDYLVSRRNGLKLNISESEIAESGGGRGLINYMLNKGFVFTRYADSFAIASGGATFYRNRLNTYKKRGLSEKEAELKAFRDFREIAEESQQSSRTDKISQQQAGDLGRVILAFANTPMQYMRIQKKAYLDLVNGRGNWKTNASKIIYYGFIQNLMFNAIQNAMFGIAFGDDETDEKLMNKSGRVANGMADSLLRGMGLYGATASMIKNTLMKIKEISEKDGKKAYDAAIFEVLNVSPTIGSKARKLRNAAISAEYGAFDDMEFSLDNEAYMALANVISATTNVPMDRALKKARNIDGALFDDVEMWQKISMLMGYQDWELGITKESDKKKKKKKSVNNIEDWE